MIQKVLKGITYALAIGASVALLGCGSGGGGGHHDGSGTNPSPTPTPSPTPSPTTGYFWNFFPDFTDARNKLTILGAYDSREFDDVDVDQASQYLDFKGALVYSANSDEEDDFGTPGEACSLTKGILTEAIANDDDIACDMEFGNALNKNVYASLEFENEDTSFDITYSLTDGEANADGTSKVPYDSSFSIEDVFGTMPKDEIASEWIYSFTFKNDAASQTAISNYETSLDGDGFACGSPAPLTLSNSPDSWDCIEGLGSGGNVYEVDYLPDADSSGDAPSMIRFEVDQ
jgi:hypothetical protein